MDVSYTDWAAGLQVVCESDGSDLPVNVLRVGIELAALHGLLRRLYSLGLPLISVICVAHDG